MQFPRRFPDWQVPFVVALACVVAAAWGDAARELLRYDRPAIVDAEYWRLLSGHFVHLGVPHLALNLAGLVLVWLLVGRLYNTRQWILAAAISILAMALGFWFLDEALRWYVGLSGLLHGLLLAGAIRGLRALPGECVVICAMVFAKLAYEQVAGPLPGSESAAGGAVVVNAHLYGAIGGVLAAGVLWRSARTPASI